MPDRIVLTWAGPPETTQAVTWRTSTQVIRAYAEIALSEGGPGFREHARRVQATTEPFTSDLSECHQHSARFEDLKPRTTYVYRVGDGTNWSEWFQFRTAREDPAPFSFVYFGDAQNDVKSLWSRVIREAHADAPRAAFMLHAGDLIDSANSDQQWGEWFHACGWLNGMIPVIATPGNHEYYSIEREGGHKERLLSNNWRPQFTLPENGPKGLEESVYTIDYQGTRIVSLNSNEQQDKQIPWLTDVLGSNPNRWTIITFHHPIYSMARGRDNEALRKKWKPVFDRFNVDLVLTGHDHTYGRSGLIGETNVASGTSTQSDRAGTVYVVSVSGPKLYEVDPKVPVDVQRVAEATQLYQIISIDGKTLLYEARMATGELYDAFELRKRDGRPNELINRIPPTPERRLPREPAESK